jgi:hypothetical protein
MILPPDLLPIIYPKIFIENLNHEQHRQTGALSAAKYFCDLDSLHGMPVKTFDCNRNRSGIERLERMERLEPVERLERSEAVERLEQWNEWNRFRSLMCCTYPTLVLNSQLIVDQLS